MFIPGIAEITSAVNHSISVMNQILTELKEIKKILKENSNSVHRT